ncbi:hypothetical protein GCM10009836_21570 [Pseudonocardia ailaonensis]|uniref:NUDIX hydrolase n=1 Tax=Pseudonocardia ailaonensis TaxID=367279 RepID=A0ABN2MYB4_9PSEU
MTVPRVVRPAAYVVCVEDGQVLLARWNGPKVPRWTLPGGGLDHGEDPRRGAIREVEEETGYTVALDRLLDVDSMHLPEATTYAGDPMDMWGVRILYSGRVTGGELRHEVGGSTDMAGWFALDEVAGLTRVPLVDKGLTAWREDDPATAAARLP